MKSKLPKVAVLATAVIAIGAMASPLMARTLTYTFGETGGGAHCDGITLKTSNGITYGGTHTGCTDNDPAGGYKVKVNGGSNLDIATTNELSESSYGALTYFLNLEQNEWYLYITSGGVFGQIDSGPLIAGAPPLNARAGATPTGSPNPKGKMDRMF
jgi:hypothetical protein